MNPHIKNLDWEDIKFLGAISEHKTVRATARHLGVHHSTVSRRVDALEHSTHTKLLSRTPEGYVLTDAGKLLAQTAVEIDQKVNRVQRVIAGGDKTLEGRILVTMPEPLAVHAIAPHLHEFKQQFPNIDVCISSSYGMADLSRQQADIAIRLSDSPDENLFGKRLLTYCNAPYVSRTHLKTLAVDNWRDCQWIGWSETLEDEPAHFDGTGFEHLSVWGAFPDLSMQTALAAKGVGMAFLPCFLGDSHENLVRASDRPPIRGRDVWILTHIDLKHSKKIQAFMKFAESILLKYKDRFEGTLNNSSHDNN